MLSRKPSMKTMASRNGAWSGALVLECLMCDRGVTLFALSVYMGSNCKLDRRFLEGP